LANKTKKRIWHLTEEGKSKRAQAHKGLIPWNKGIPLSEETKRKMSQAHMGKLATFKGRKHSLESRLKQSQAHKGKHPSLETRLKISKSVKHYFARKKVF